MSYLVRRSLLTLAVLIVGSAVFALVMWLIQITDGGVLLMGITVGAICLCWGMAGMFIGPDQGAGACRTGERAMKKPAWLAHAALMLFGAACFGWNIADPSASRLPSHWGAIMWAIYTMWQMVAAYRTWNTERRDAR